MNIDQLKYFIAVAESMHLTSAADELNISEPAMSKAISRLEDEIGCKLFDRVGRNIQLSDSGEIFLPYAKSAVKELNDGLYEITLRNALDNNTVKIQCLPLILFPGLLHRILESYPDIAFMSSGAVPAHELENNLLTHKSDLCISSKIIQNKSFDSVTLVNEPLQLIVSDRHPFASEDKIHISDMLNDRFILTAQHSSLIRDYNALFQDAQQKPITIVVSNINETLEYIALDNLVAVMTGTIYYDLLRRQTKGTRAIGIVDDHGDPICCTQYLYCRKKHNKPDTKGIKKLLIDYFSNYTAKEQDVL